MSALMEKQGAAADAAREGSRSGTPARERPKLDVPFCASRLKPLWLPIKAHRFTAYRSKVLQLLPQKILAQYVEHEKQAHYSACIKLLESSTAGNLNVLQPNHVISGK